MRLRHPGGTLIHLSCGTNVHPVRDVDGIVGHLETYACAIRARLAVQTLGVSLWLPPVVAAALAIDAGARARLRAELDARGLEVVTLSGVPYQAGGAGGPARHQPDWTTVDRLEYTLDLARVLVDLLPDDAVRGSVSTSGLGRRAGWGGVQANEAARVLRRLSAGLTEIAWHTGRAVRVGFQPEPGCVMDGTEQTIAALAGTDSDRLGICLNLANLACTWERPAEALDRFAAAGVSVVRVQVAAGIEAADPGAAAETLRGYAEPEQPHQVCTPTGGYADSVDQALRDFPPGPWRIRYHVPLHCAPAAPLAATTDVWRTALRRLMAGDVPACEHLDVQTETWELLPPGERATGPAALAEGIAAEFAYTRQELDLLGLAPSEPAGGTPVSPAR
jgi:sugar phosphate isomerase/epimerase